MGSTSTSIELQPTAAGCCRLTVVMTRGDLPALTKGAGQHLPTSDPTHLLT